MAEPKKVLGSDCLAYIDKAIGFCSKGVPESQRESFRYHVKYNPNWDSLDGDFWDSCEVVKFKHDVSKRIVGLVDRKFSDGGYKVYILGNEDFKANDHNIGFAYNQYVYFGTHRLYQPEFEDPRGAWEPKGEFQTALSYGSRPNGTSNYAFCNFRVSNIGDDTLTEFLDYYPLIEENAAGSGYLPYCVPQTGTITNDKNNTLVFGAETDYNTYGQPHMIEELRDDPLVYLSGNLYEAYNYIFSIYRPLSNQKFPNYADMVSVNLDTGEELMTGNGVAVPYNIILTYNEIYAKAYLENGTLPPDAFLFPLDWEDLPRYNPEEDVDDDTDDGYDDDDDNHPGVDGDPNLPEVPEFTISKLTNNNFYWLDVGQLQQFINWFWYDIGNMSSFDDLFNKIKGLYDDLASTILMIRYMPVDINWIGGLGANKNIILGMIEFNGGAMPTIAKANPPIVEIGHVHVDQEYKSFFSYSPYAQASIYLPYHGMMELDIDLVSGRDIYVKGMYDHITGTLTYLIYLENKWLINTVTCKMAVDIPITLQTKNERDSAIFQNVSSALSGLIGAGSTIATGNPLGLIMGASSLAGAGAHSAPLSVKGVVGEQGAFYAPQKCCLVTSFPVQQKPTNFKSIMGMQVNKAYKLSEISGYTECLNPRLTFSKTVPLHDEEEEIYNYLEKGVIL